VTTMHLIAQYKQFATDYRRLAATLTKPDDKQALELFATGWGCRKSRGDAPQQKQRVKAIQSSTKDNSDVLLSRGFHLSKFPD
jgi:hypothetical protein